MTSSTLEAPGSRTDTTMRVGVMAGIRDISVQDVPTPTAGPGEILVRLRATAICTWEQRSYSGAQGNKFPFVGGHEMAGEVAAIGPGTDTDLQIGERVAVGSASCGRCHWCKTGQDRACKQHYGIVSKYGAAWGPGGFAQYKVQTADGVYRVGDASFETAALSEPLSCALHANRLLDLRVGQDVVVIGAGVMGLMNIVAARQYACRVIVSEVDPVRLAMARRMGATEVIDATKVDPVARVRELTEGRGAEAVIAAIGHENANEQGMAMLSDRGRFVLFAAAHPEPDFTFMPNEMHNRETGVIGVISGEKQDFYAATRLIRYGLVDLSPLIDARYPLEEIEAALEHAVKPGTYRVIVEL
ncbi:MAG TPA: zinc-binding dehydrogenase [Candidatus Sulfomarinibacteraceae bacterium]|nr:zinc-binding dehydrogenase [Candidatus Sulfomarinibacteraceae bacterium]